MTPSTRFHVLVTPVPDEPLIVTQEWIDAGQAWLDVRVADGRFEMCLPFEQTGGFVLLSVPVDDRVEARRVVEGMWADYPLLSTVDMEINVVLPTLRDGFDVLREAQVAGRRIDA